MELRLRGGESAQFRRRGGKYRGDGTGENLQGTDHGHRNEGYEKGVFRHCCTLFVVYKFFNQIHVVSTSLSVVPVRFYRR
jgi:hypothetical protein